MTSHVDLINAIGREPLAEAIAGWRGMNWNDSFDRRKCADQVYQWIVRGQVAPIWRPFVERIALARGLAHAIPDGFLDPPREDKQELGQKSRPVAA